MDLPVLGRIRLWCPAVRERHYNKAVCVRARARARCPPYVCVRRTCASYVRVCTAVSTVWIGMPGMIGIEFFKNAFSPPGGVGTVQSGRPGPVRRTRPPRGLSANTRAKLPLPRHRPWRGHNRPPRAATTTAAEDPPQLPPARVRRVASPSPTRKTKRPRHGKIGGKKK